MRIWNVQGRRSLTSQWLANVYFIIFMIELFIVFMTIIVFSEPGWVSGSSLFQGQTPSGSNRTSHSGQWACGILLGGIEPRHLGHL